MLSEYIHRLRQDQINYSSFAISRPSFLRFHTCGKTYYLNYHLHFSNHNVPLFYNTAFFALFQVLSSKIDDLFKIDLSFQFLFNFLYKWQTALQLFRQCFYNLIPPFRHTYRVLISCQRIFNHGLIFYL